MFLKNLFIFLALFLMIGAILWFRSGNLFCGISFAIAAIMFFSLTILGPLAKNNK